MHEPTTLQSEGEGENHEERVLRSMVPSKNRAERGEPTKTSQDVAAAIRGDSGVIAVLCMSSLEARLC